MSSNPWPSRQTSRLSKRFFRRRATPDIPNPALWPRHTTRLEPLTFRRAPTLFAAAFFATGIFVHRFVYHPAALWLLAVALLAALTVAALRTPTAIVPLAALWLIAGITAAALQPAPSAQSTLRTYADNLSRTVRGRVTRIRTLPPRPPTEGTDTDGYQEDELPGALSIDLAVEAIEDLTPDLSRMVSAPGGIRATLYTDSAPPTLHCGETIEAPMRLRLPEVYRDPGAWQYADYLIAQGIAAHANLHTTHLTVLNDARPTLQCRLYAAQSWASNRMLTFVRSPANRRLPSILRLGPDDAGMLNAMLFGDRAGLNHQLRLGFERTGSFHLFVVSGMHIGLIAVGLFWITRRVHLPLWASTIITIALTTAYAFLTGFGVPVQRALAMATIVLLARLLDRRQNTLNAFGFAVLLVLAWSPSALAEASFQMTFLAIVGVAGIALPLGERTLLPYAHAARRLDDLWLDPRMPPPLAQFRVSLRLLAEPLPRPLRSLPALLTRITLWTLELCLIGIVTEAVMTLPMALYFHRATLFALPANLFSIPLIGILVPSALLTFTAALFSPWAAMIPGAATAVMLHAVTAAIGHISRIQLADLRTPGPTLPIALAVATLFALCVWLVRRPDPRWSWLVAAILPLTVLLILRPTPPQTHPTQLEVTALDVGQGDAIFILSPTGQTMLIDAGGPIGGPTNRADAPTTGFDLGEEVVAPYLWSRHLRSLDIVALTHEHSDHMGGLPAILRDFRPRELWLGADVPSRAYRDLLVEAATLGIAIRHLHAGDTLPWDEVQIAVLSPEPTYINPASPKNDDSLVLHLQYGAASVLLEGDAEKPSERAMLDHDRIHPVTLLKVGHHGSSTSSTEAFLTAAAPHDAVISSGQGNPFGHPRPEVVARFAAHHIKLYRTDLFGPVTFLLTPEGTIREAAGISR